MVNARSYGTRRQVTSSGTAAIVMLGLSAPSAGQPLTPFVEAPSSGRVRVELHVDPAAAKNLTHTGRFGVPFPKGVVSTVGQLRVVDHDGRPLPMAARELARWRGLGRTESAESLRAALVTVAIPPAALAKGAIFVEYGSGAGDHAAALDAPADAAAQDVEVTLDPHWLGEALLRTRTRPIGSDPEFRWFDEALLGYARTAVNDVANSVALEHRIDYTTSAEPWQLDRASTLWNVYIRTGEHRWLRHAREATRTYASHIGPDGAFDLKTSYPDLKYSYGLPLLIDYLLGGDDSLLAVMERIAQFAARFPETYSTELGFWTERHQAYALLAALTAWEATGREEHAKRTIEVARATFRAALEPARDWPADGCVLHTIRQHEGDDDDRPACSPWMSALLAEAVWRYYLHAEDPQALEFLADLGRFTARYGVRDISDAHPRLEGLWAPWYLASRNVEYTDSGPWADLEHQCDVAGLAARGAWAARKLGQDADEVIETLRRLTEGCQRNLATWRRSNDPARPEWRLTPPRKFNWWFGTTSDLGWLIESLERDDRR